jgi:hypothetical protein
MLCSPPVSPQVRHPVTVTFNASASTGQGKFTYYLYISQRARSSVVTPGYTFEQPGDYGVGLWPTDETGNLSEAYQVIRVEGTTPKVVIQVPFVIDTDEVAGATDIVSLPLGSAPLYTTRF